MQDLAKAYGVSAIVNMQHHPWGNSYFRTQACGGGPYSSTTRHCWATTCVESSHPPADCFADLSTIVVQHGQTEYEVNRLQACAKSITADDEDWATRYWPYNVCIEEAYRTSASDSCAKAAGIPTDTLNACFQGAQGDAIMVAEAMATVDHAGTPTIMVNGKVISSASAVLREVCSAYLGPKPQGCRTKELCV